MAPPHLLEHYVCHSGTFDGRNRTGNVDVTRIAPKADEVKTERVIWRRIIEVERNPDALKKEILDVFDGPKHRKHRAAIGKTFRLLERYCGNQMRKNGRMLEICHALLVMRDVALVTGDWLLAIHAGTHDLGEDTKHLRKRDRVTGTMLDCVICKGAGKRLDMLSNMKGKTWDQYGEYLGGVYGSGDVGVILIKLFDHLEKSKELEGCQAALVKGTIVKALGALRVALKIHPDLACAIHTVLEENAAPQFQGEISRTFGSKLDQAYLEKREFVFVSSRKGGITTALLETMPVAGSRIIAVSTPVDATKLKITSRADMPIEAIMVPFVSRLTRQEAIELLNRHFEGLGLVFRSAKSHWPRALRCYHIAAAGQVRDFEPPPNYKDLLVDAIEKLPGKIFGEPA